MTVEELIIEAEIQTGRVAHVRDHEVFVGSVGYMEMISLEFTATRTDQTQTHLSSCSFAR